MGRKKKPVTEDTQTPRGGSVARIASGQTAENLPIEVRNTIDVTDPRLIHVLRRLIRPLVQMVKEEMEEEMRAEERSTRQKKEPPPPDAS